MMERDTVKKKVWEKPDLIVLSFNKTNGSFGGVGIEGTNYLADS